MEICGKKNGDAMPEKALLRCCNKKIDLGELWVLKDFKGFTGRKLFLGKCKICGDDAALQIMTHIKTGKKYCNLYNGLKAVQLLYRERKRKIAVIPNVKTNSLQGWIYGINVEIKSKNGTQIRQYASDFKGNRTLVETKILS